MHVRVLGIALVLATAACVRGVPLEPSVSARVDSPFTLRVGQEATFEDIDLSVRFVGISEDSRCPLDVTCVWAGDARVDLLLRQSGTSEEILNLHTNLEPRRWVVGRYQIMLEELSPLPRSSAIIPPEHYVAEFRVSLGQ